MPTLQLKPSYKVVKAYYDEVRHLQQLSLFTEGAVSPAFAALLRHCAGQVNWTLAEQFTLKRKSRTLRVEKLRLSRDKTQLVVNDFLTLDGIPPEAFAYRLGNRSALEWIIDRYRVTADPRSGIVNDPNRRDDPQSIVHLIGQVLTVSVETVKIVNALPGLGSEGEKQCQISFRSSS